MWEKLNREERIELIRQGIAKGMSTGKIAVWIGGCTRNAIIGLAGRNKIKLAHSDPRQETKLIERRRQRREKATLALITVSQIEEAVDLTAPSTRRAPVPPRLRPMPVSLPVITAPVPRLLQLTELNGHTCKWPVGDPQIEGFGFCGNDKGLEGSYCQFHTKLASRPLPARRLR